MSVIGILSGVIYGPPEKARAAFNVLAESYLEAKEVGGPDVSQPGKVKFVGCTPRHYYGSLRGDTLDRVCNDYPECVFVFEFGRDTNPERWRVTIWKASERLLAYEVDNSNAQSLPPEDAEIWADIEAVEAAQKTPNPTADQVPIPKATTA